MNVKSICMSVFAQTADILNIYKLTVKTQTTRQLDKLSLQVTKYRPKVLYVCYLIK